MEKKNKKKVGTGLLNKKGMELFEGDVIDIPNDELEKQLKIAEKALELACEELIEDESFESEDDRHFTLHENITYFENMARKEIINESKK